MSEPTELRVGESTWSFRLPEGRRVELSREIVGPPSGTPAEMTREALEHPHGFEAMRRALTPDDRVTIVLDPAIPSAAAILAEVLLHLQSGGVQPDAVTVLTIAGADKKWVEDLPDEFADVRTEVHDPADRNKLAYLASTKAGRRLYLNRTLLDADFVVVLSGREYDPMSGYAGAESAIFPALADEDTRAAFRGQFTSDAPGKIPWPTREEALEVMRLIGMPFLVQVISGVGATVQEVVAGLPDSSAEGIRRQNARWHATVSEEPDTVLATIGGVPEQTTFLDIAKAAACAARVVKKGGRIAVLTTAAPDLGEGAKLLRSMEGPTGARKLLAKEKPEDWDAAWLWAFAAKNHSLFLASGYPDEVVEELFATPIHSASELQRLVDTGEKVLIIPYAHKTMVTRA